jgi:uncharacterized protein YndB with AHSA1/START domain
LICLLQAVSAYAHQVERFFALLTDQHLRRAYFGKPDIA